jgi:hypothetical protein
MYDDEESTFNEKRFQDKVQSTFLATGTIPREDKSFLKFTYKPSGGTTSVAPTGTNKKYSKSHYDDDVQESEGNEQYSAVVDILEEWMFDESLDDFDPDIFDNDNNTMDDEIHSVSLFSFTVQPFCHPDCRMQRNLNFNIYNIFLLQLSFYKLSNTF